MKKKTVVILCVVVSLLVVSICAAVYFATYSLGAITKISVHNNQSDTYVLQMRYLFASGGYSVRNVAEDEGEYIGDGMIDYDGAIGRYRFLIEFGDVNLTDQILKQRDEKGIIQLTNEICAKVVYPSDHGFVLYVGCDKPMKIETIEGVQLNPLGGTIKIPFSITEPVRESIPNLNMATLKSLVDICGDDLSWDTFAPYWNKDVGSGIYILRYPVDADYCLVISGTSMDTPPDKIILEALHSPEKCIDIRTESIDAFVATGVAANATSAAKENILNAALKHCKTNYDYTDIRYIFDDAKWHVEFWENDAKVAAQRVTLDKDGNVLGISYAE